MNDVIRYRLNRFLSYYLLDFSATERFGLWCRFLAHEIIGAPRIVEAKLTDKPVHSRYVISLPYRGDRRAHIKQEFGRFAAKFDFFDAIGPRGIQHYGHMFDRRAFDSLTVGSKGCAISHMLLWHKVVQCSTNELTLIFEDDAILSNDMNRVIESAALPSDVDIVFFGSWNTRGRDIDYFVGTDLFKAYNPRKGLYAYGITSSGAQKLLKYCSPLRLIYGGLDTQVGKLVRQGKVTAYHFYPSLVTVDFNFPSDIYNPSQKTKRMYYF